MLNIKKYISLLSTPKSFCGQVWYVVKLNFLRLSRFYLSDRLYLRMKYRLFVGGGPIDFDHPVTYNEKMQWIKMNDRKEIYHKMVDKIDAKKFIAETVGAEFVIPTIKVWESVKDISIDDLPSKFILKNTFDSGTYSICRDKNDFDLSAAKAKLNKTRGSDYYLHSREWPYKGLPQRIIAEELLDTGTLDSLIDYKIMTFSGEPKLLFILTERGKREEPYQDIFDMDGRLVDYCQLGYYNNPETPKLPENFSKMKSIAKVLAKDTYCLRVDFYETCGKIYVGELTFFDAGGFSKFSDPKIDFLWGDWIKIPKS